MAARLQRFRLDGIRDTGIEIGSGSYAVVKELDFRGLKCVGKKLHSLLYEGAAPRERADLLRRFEEECEILSQLHHPNVVQFLGVHMRATSGLPALVMEYLPANLSGCLDKHGVLPAEFSLGILRDVALGLCYLHEHSPPVIHRDLSANNVLLTTSMSAKISDLGVAKILDMSSSHAARMTQTQVPGTPSYMPPETMVARPKYTTKVDIFSMGVLIVHVLSGEWPIPSEQFVEDSQDPNKVISVTEYDRRRGTIQKIEDGCSLLGLIQQCLSNIPNHRPIAVEVVRQVREAYSQVSTSPKNRLELLQQVQSLKAELQQCKELQGERTLAAKSLHAELASKTQDYNILYSKYSKLFEQKNSLRTENDSRKQKNSSLQTEIEGLRAKARGLTVEIKGLRTKVRDLTVEIEGLRVKVRNRTDELRATRNQSPTGMGPHVRMKWRKGANFPGSICGQAVVVGEKVYVGGWFLHCGNIVYQYDWRSDTWDTLPDCPVARFGMAQFLGKLTTVGGQIRPGIVTGNVYQFDEQMSKWEQFLPCMPTARFQLTVVTCSRLSAIAACGGFNTGGNAVDTVEVYSHTYSQWYTSESLPISCYCMTSAVIDDTCYVMGGWDSEFRGTKHCFSANLNSLVNKATSHSSESSSSIWISVDDTPLLHSTAATLRECPIAVGGWDSTIHAASASINVFNIYGSWERVKEGEIPESCHQSAAICLPSDELLVIKNGVLIGSIVD